MRSFHFFSIAIFLFLFSCSAPQEPIFKDMKNVTARMMSAKEILVSGIAVYENPNAVGGDLTAINVSVQVDEIDAGKLEQNLSVAVPANSTFEVPFEFRFDPAKVFKKKGILGSVISILEKKSVDVKYEGTITMKMMSVSFDVPVDFEESVSLGR